jgi:hypothetical protein
VSDAETYLRLLTTGATGPLEGTAGGARELGAADRVELLDRLRAEVAYLEARTGHRVDPVTVARVADSADAGLQKLFGEGADAELDISDVAGLEAVVRADGSRPVLFVEDDFVDLTAPSASAYAAVLAHAEGSIRQVCAAVGRVDDPGAAPLGYQGTAWAVAEGVVLTAYHVLEAAAPGSVRRAGRFEGRLNVGVAVHFGHEVGRLAPERRFPVRRVLGVGPEGAADFLQDSGLNFDGLDVAVLELEPVPGRAFPEPIRVARGDDRFTRGALTSAGRGIYLVGFPGNQHSTEPKLFVDLFFGVKGCKRLAPGFIQQATEAIELDPRRWVLTHDASTLGGNSGSAVLDLDGDAGVALGLHFAGRHLRKNWAHTLERTTGILDHWLAGTVR